MDPSVTDAYNSLILGHKWWIHLSKDFYEFNLDWTCDPTCSSNHTDDMYNSEAWYNTIYPQMR